MKDTLKEGDIFYPTISINIQKGIPQIGDKTWMKLNEGDASCMILSIESIQYDERLKIKIKYKAKVLKLDGIKNNRYLHVVE